MPPAYTDRQFQTRYPERAMGNVFIRIMKLHFKGDEVVSHKHNFDHVTYCVKGGLRIELMDGEEKAVEMQPGDSLLIKADTLHHITALEDNTEGHCIYSHRTPQGEIVQEFTGWERAYI